MPTYRFKNKETGEEHTDFMSISAMEKYLEENPHISPMLTQINIVDPTGIGVSKPPSDFSKYVLGKVATQPGAKKSTFEKRWSIPKEW